MNKKVYIVYRYIAVLNTYNDYYIGNSLFSTISYLLYSF